MSNQDRGALSVVLIDHEVLMAQTAVRKYLTKIRGNQRNAVRRGASHEHYAETNLRRFDDYLDLYIRLGGNPDEIRDPEDHG